MIFEWMLYVSVVSAGFALGAEMGERAARLWGLPRRWIWCGALAAVIGVALLAWPLHSIPDRLSPAPKMDALRPAAVVDAPSAFYTLTADLQLRVGDLDGELRLGWMLLTFATLVALGTSARTLGRHLQGCVLARVNGRRVLLSEELGPAVIGFIRPRIVLPQWVLEADREERELILAHEEEHLYAGDQRLVALTLVVLVATPWNPALWWIFHRMREAIELDCDQRVLRGGRDVTAYGNLILRTSGRPSVGLGYGAPFGSPSTSLERRIDAMIAATPRFRLLRGSVAAASTLLLLLATGWIDRPSGVAYAQDPSAATLRSPDGPGSRTPDQDGRVAVNYVAALPDVETEGLIVLEVKAGPSYFMNRQPVPVAELRSFVRMLYAPRPRKVLFAKADAGVPEIDLNAAVNAARLGLADALEEEKLHGGPGAAAAVNVVGSPR